LSEVEVEEALDSCQKKGLVTRIVGGRVERWRHELYEAWKLSKVELAVLAELLLRGAQTEGELRGRASRMEPVDDLDALRGVLRPLAERRLIIYLGPEGRRGTTVTHGFSAAEEIAQQSAARPADRIGPGPADSPSPRPDVAEAELESLRASLLQLQTDVASLKEQVQQIKAALGV
jgi:uncharacterized protein YceH (UPF0502 family)